MKRYSKLIDEFNKGVHKSARQDRCIICDREMTSACNSHVVPQFVLKEIADGGEVAYGYIFSKRDVQGCEKITGIKNAHTFRLICKNCDRTLFTDYENPNNILDFDSLPSELKTKMLREMSLKAHLSHIQTKYNRLITKDIVTGGAVSRLEKEGKLSPERIDLIEHLEYIENINNASYKVLFNKQLDYNVGFATQTLFYYVYDMKGHKLFNIHDLKTNEKISPFYLSIIPLKGTTRILFFVDKEIDEKANRLVNQFNELTEEEKFKFVFVSLIVFDQEFYVNPSIAKNIVKNDKKLVRLYTCTDQYLYWPIDNRKKIKNFRKYHNYLADNMESLFKKDE